MHNGQLKLKFRLYPLVVPTKAFMDMLEFWRVSGVSRKRCKEIGISRFMPKLWLSGACMPSLGSVLKICDYYACSLEDLLGERPRLRVPARRVA